MKTRILPLFLLILCLCALFSSCASFENPFALLAEEWDDIAEFFEEQQPVESRGSLLPADGADPPLPRALKAQPHIEIIESAYNSPDKIASIRRLDDPASLSVPSGEADRTGYEAIPRFADLSASAVSAILAAHGMTAEVSYLPNPAPAGEVFGLRYAGSSDENGYYMNPSVPVTLYVSDRKKAAFQPDPGEAGVVYLTFDDGPTEDGTEKLLDILDEYGIKAAFFTVGDEVVKYPDSARMILDRGHTLACHTMTHVYEEIYESPDALIADVEEWEKAAREIGGGEDLPKIFRFPGGSFGIYLDGEKSLAMKEKITENGWRIFDWNSTANDAVLYLRPWGESDYEYICETFLTSFGRSVKEADGRKGWPLIVLMHETPETLDLAPWIIEQIIAGGFAFGNLENYPESWVFPPQDEEGA